MPIPVSQAIPNELLTYNREKRGWSELRLATSLEVPVSEKTIERAEAGTTPNIYPSTKDQIAKLLKPEVFKKNRKEAWKQLGFVEEGEIPFWHIEHAENPIFTGRENILSQIALLPIARNKHKQKEKLPSQYSPQVLTGLAGVGKTQIVVEYVSRSKKEYHTVILLNADSSTTLHSELAGLAQILDLPEQNALDPNRTIEAVKQWFSSPFLTRWLLIFDNVDSPQTMQMVMNFLPREYYGHVLLTTRMDDPGTEVYGLEQIRVKSMQKEDGATLLLRRAGIIGKEGLASAVSENDHKEAISMSTTLGGLPLALDQAGAYMRENKKTVREYAVLYKARRAELLRYRGNYAETFKYSESVMVTFSLNFEQVGEEAQELLKFFAFFSPDNIPEELTLVDSNASESEGTYTTSSGRFFVPDASEIMHLDEVTKNLYRYSLIERLASEKLFSVHRLVQAVVQDQMTKEEQRVWAEKAVTSVCRVSPFLYNDEQFDSNLALRDIGRKQIQRSLPHALLCAQHIEQWNLPCSNVTVRLLWNVGMYLQNQGLVTQAESLFRQLVALISKGLEMGGEVEDTVLPHALSQLAHICKIERKDNEAEELYKQAKDILINEYIILNLNAALFCLADLGELYRIQKRFADAEVVLQQAVDIFLDLATSQANASLTPLNNLADLYVEQGKYNEAEKLYKEIILRAEKEWRLDAPGMADFYNNLAHLYLKQEKNCDEAEILLQKALSIARQEHPMHQSVAGICANLAYLFNIEKKYTEAEQMFSEASAIFQKIFGDEHPDFIKILRSQAISYFSQNRFDEAISFYERIFAVLKRNLNKDQYDGDTLIGVLYELARSYHSKPLYRPIIYPEGIIGDPYGISVVTDSQGNVLGPIKYFDAITCFEQAEELYLTLLKPFEVTPGAEQWFSIVRNSLEELYLAWSRLSEGHYYVKQITANPGTQEPTKQEIEKSKRRNNSKRKNKQS